MPPTRQPIQALLPTKVSSAMIPETATAPPTGEDWVHEVKFDGYRILARLDGSQVQLVSRHGVDWTDKFSAVYPRQSSYQRSRPSWTGK